MNASADKAFNLMPGEPATPAAILALDPQADQVVHAVELSSRHACSRLVLIMGCDHPSRVRKSSGNFAVHSNPQAASLRQFIAP